MKNNEDWEELEKWSKKQEDKYIKDYGVDISKVNLNKQTKRMNIFAKFVGAIYKLIKYSFITIVILAFCGGLGYAYMQFDNFGRLFDVGDVEKNIKKEYNIKIREISKETDEKGNGKYVFTLKDNKNIIFTAFKNGANSSNDLMENCHKYYFEKWDSQYKDSFKINEEINNDLLSYSTYIEINCYQDIDNAMNKMNEFVEYSKEYFYPMWKIYLKKDNLVIYPYTMLDILPEEAIREAKRVYLKYLKNNNITEEVRNEEFEEYLTLE